MPDQNQTRYQIHFKSLTTGNEGHGDASLPKEPAQTLCDSLNHDWEGLFEHWIEPVEEEEKTISS